MFSFLQLETTCTLEERREISKGLNTHPRQQGYKAIEEQDSTPHNAFATTVTLANSYTAALSPVHTDSAANSNLVPNKLSVPKSSVRHYCSQLFLVLPRFDLARIERTWLDSA